jgi:hypothetical protein
MNTKTGKVGGVLDLVGEPRCKSCDFFMPNVGGKAGEGECREGPPSVVLAGMNTAGISPQPIFTAMHPRTAEGHYCGRWKPQGRFRT